LNRLTTLQIYHLKKEKEEEFIATWKLLNDLYFRYASCLEARMHRVKLSYYEYLSWSDALSYKQSFSSLPPAALALKARMRSCCVKTEELIEMEGLVEQRNTRLRSYN
jgi:hypothetical protein